MLSQLLPFIVAEDREDEAANVKEWLNLLREFSIDVLLGERDTLGARSQEQDTIQLALPSVKQQREQLQREMQLEGLDLGELVGDNDFQEQPKVLSVREEAMARRKQRLESSKKSDKREATALPLVLPKQEWGMKMKLALAARNNLLSGTWTVRHGGLLALKAILPTYCSADASSVREMATREILAGLVWDRFGDFQG